MCWESWQSWNDTLKAKLVHLLTNGCGHLQNNYLLKLETLVITEVNFTFSCLFGELNCCTSCDEPQVYICRSWRYPTNLASLKRFFFVARWPSDFQPMKERWYSWISFMLLSILLVDSWVYLDNVIFEETNKMDSACKSERK